MNNAKAKAAFGERVAAWVWNHRRTGILACLGLTLLAGWFAKDVRVDNAIDIWFVADDPALVAYRDFQERFGNDEIVVVAFHDADGILDADGLRLVRRATRALAAVDGVARAESLATLPRLQASARGLEAVPVLPAGTISPKAAGALRDAITADPTLAGRLVSPDRTTALVLAHMASLTDMDSRRAAIIADMDATLQDLGAPYRMLGIGVIYEALNRLSMVDSGVLIVAAYGLTALLLWLLYGRVAPTLVTLGVVGAAVIWTMGAYGAAGRSINMVTMVMPTLITVIGIANCIHILRHVARRPRGGSRRDRVVAGVGHMFRPCLFTTLTTSAGFAALAASPMPVIRDLGIFSAGGLIAVFALTIVCCTWALAWERAEPVATAKFRIGAGTAWMANLGLAHSGRVLAGAALLALVAGFGLSRLVVDTDPIDFMFADHPLRQDYRAVESRFDGYTPLEFVVRRDGAILDGEVIAATGEWQRDAEALAEVGWSYSAADWMASLSRLSDGPPNPGIPADALTALAQCCPDLAAQSSALLDSPDALRVTFAIHIQSARGIAGIIDKIMAEADFPTGVTVTAAGYLPLYVRMVDYVVSSQVWSFALALVAIFAAIAILFRSAGLALLSLPGNLLPVFLTLGVMGLIGVRLDVATVTIAAVVLGIVVDDTVLFLHGLRHEPQRPCARRSTAPDNRS
jgi:predicted RND superfamily exporter protein